MLWSSWNPHCANGVKKKSACMVPYAQRCKLQNPPLGKSWSFVNPCAFVGPTTTLLVWVNPSSTSTFICIAAKPDPPSFVHGYPTKDTRRGVPPLRFVDVNQIHSKNWPMLRCGESKSWIANGLMCMLSVKDFVCVVPTAAGIRRRWTRNTNMNFKYKWKK